MPEEYLADYYAVVEPDELETIAFFTDAMRETTPDEPILFFGTGPTLHHVFLSADRASEIHLADYLPQNLAAIERWLQRDPGAHDWRPFVRYTLECEGERAPTEAQLAEREELTRAKVTRLLEADAGDREPVGERYGTVVSAYCADSATADRATWEAYMRHIAGLVRPGGVFITAALRRSRSYLVGGKHVPERRRRRARPARGARARVRLLDRGPRGARARAARLRGHRARYGHSTPTSVGSGSSLTPKRSSHAARDLAGEREQLGGGAAAAVGERERVLRGDRDPLRVAVALVEAGALDQPGGRGLDAPVVLGEARRALGRALLERRELVRGRGSGW